MAKRENDIWNMCLWLRDFFKCGREKKKWQVEIDLVLAGHFSQTFMYVQVTWVSSYNENYVSRDLR